MRLCGFAGLTELSLLADTIFSRVPVSHVLAHFIFYQLPLILTALMHVNLINIAYLKACVPLSCPDDVALFE